MNEYNFDFSNIPIFQCVTIQNGKLVHYSINSEDDKFNLVCDGNIVAFFNNEKSAYDYYMAEFR